MNADKHRFLKSRGARLSRSRVLIGAVCLLSGFWLQISATHAAIFTNNARVEIAENNHGLTWNTVNNALTISCWFKIAIPSGTKLTDNMVIVVNRRSGTESDPRAYLIQFNIYNGNIEFSTRGSSGAYTNTLIERPYQDRWYHVAVVRQGEIFTGYVDGREVFNNGTSVGDAGNNDGTSIGGWSNGKYLFGEVQEFAVYQAAFGQSFILDNMFQDQRNNSQLTAYYKLGYSTNTADNLKNFAPTGPTGPGTIAGGATLQFEETDQAGEQSAFDSRRNGGRDAVSPLSGSFSWQQTALARPTPGIAFDFRFGYGSANAFGGFKLGSTDPFNAGPLGPGWRHTFETRLLPAQAFDPSGGFNVLGLMSWDGAIETWDLDVNTEQYNTRNNEYRGELTQLSLTQFQWVTPDRMIYIFRNPNLNPQVMNGRLLEIRDFNTNSVKINWDQTIGVITQVVDSARGTYSFRYNPQNLLTNVSFGSWSAIFSYDPTNRLISKTLTNTSGAYTSVNTTWRFDYGTNGLLAGVIDPRNFTNIFAQYDQYGRKTNEVDALNRATATRYGIPGKRQITRIDPGTNSWIETYDRKGHILAQQDPLTNITSYAYDTNGNRISITEPLGWTTSFGYDTRANVIARTNALGEITRWTFHSFFNKATNEVNALGWTNSYAYDAGGNLTNHADALGSLVRYTYSTNGLVLTSTDANGNTSQFAYDTNGFLIARTDPAINTWQFTVNDVGWKLAEINPFNDTTFLAYDLNGNTVQTTDPINRTFTRQWDANGNLVAQSDGKNQFTCHAYDAANQRVATTNRVGSVWFFSFTSRGKPDRVTDPLGNTTTNFYDSANRLTAVSDPLGNSITNQYDANGNSVALFDTLGQRWSKTFDRLNRVIAESDPQGDTKQTSYDPVGRISQIITPNGFPSLHFYDGRGRLTKWKDAEGFDWLYAYDGNSNITNITDALGGHYVMVYSNRNERTLERNQDNFEWQYAYDQLLRLKTQRDPNLTLRTRTYDAASRVTSHTLSTGREDTYTPLDNNDNPQAIVRRVNGVAVATTSLTYDLLDRVTRVVDPNGQRLDYGFDALSRIVSVTYPGNHVLTNRYDALSRLTNQVDWAARQMSYAYDKAGRLIRRAYPNGVVQTNTFDSAGRLTGLSHQASSIPVSSNQISVALTYAYDRNGNKVGNSERGTFAWPMPSLTDEASRFTPSGRLIDRSVQNTISNQLSTINYAYDSSGNMTNAVGGGQSWRLTYDEDNRTTSILWDAGITSKLITNRYDALGRRIARKVDGVETRYVLDLSGSMERILCDTTASGQITAWYIHGPDLCYRVDASNNVIYYHADAQANIISVTDGGGTDVAQYAYTPYGRSLGSTNLQPQISNPYLFVGSQGVMEELPGLYFMRARYYSADAGLFLSTDPVKKIGPGWKPEVFAYARGNPYSYSDPSGNQVEYLAEKVAEFGEQFVARAVFDIMGVVSVSTLRVVFGYSREEAIQAVEPGVDFLNKALADGRGGDAFEWLAQQAFEHPGNQYVPHQVDWSTIASGPKFQQSPAYQQIKSVINASPLIGGGGGGGATSGMANKTPAAANNATVANAGQSQPSVSAGNQSASTSSSGGGSGSSGHTTSSSSSGGGGNTITIPSGATLSGIARQYGTTVSALASLNHISNPNVIRAGATLRIR